MKILFYSTKPYDELLFSRVAKEEDIQVHFLTTRLNEKTASLARGYEQICIFVNDDLSKSVVELLVSMGVKGVLLRCSGFNQVDLAAIRGKLRVLRVPSYSPEAVAEFAMAQLLTVNRKTHRAYNRTREFNMNIHGFLGTNLHGKTIGIVGTGKIGQAMIRICKGFGMRVLAYDLYPNPAFDVEYVELKQLFQESDVISLHCPLTEESHYMIRKETLDMMKPGVYIMNTSRGELICTEDLLEALVIPGKIGGVGMDVYEEEEDLFYEDKSNEIMTDDHLARLMTFPNVLITSHQAYFTKEAVEEIASVTIQNARAVEQGEESPNEV